MVGASCEQRGELFEKVNGNDCGGAKKRRTKNNEGIGVRNDMEAK